MTVTTMPCMGALPQAASQPTATTPYASPDLNTQLSTLVQQLQQLSQQLSQLAAQLGASTLAGGAAGAPQASGGLLQSVLGTTALGQTNALGANAAPTTFNTDPASLNSAPAKQGKGRKKARSKQGLASYTGMAGVDTKFDLKRNNPRSTAEAIAWAKRQVTNPSRDYNNLCLGFVARAYGWSGSGVYSAIKAWEGLPDSVKHQGDQDPPTGALVFWKTGTFGHVALYLGNGMIASNDIRRKGKIDIVPMSEISKKWGAQYLGWTEPYFPNAG